MATNQTFSVHFADFQSSLPAVSIHYIPQPCANHHPHYSTALVPLRLLTLAVTLSSIHDVSSDISFHSLSGFHTLQYSSTPDSRYQLSSHSPPIASRRSGLYNCSIYGNFSSLEFQRLTLDGHSASD